MFRTVSSVPIAVALLFTGTVAFAAPPRIVGIAFVDNTVTGKGSKAQLPPGAKIYPSGAKITGSEGCPTSVYGTDGLIVAVIDYDGKPNAGSLTILRLPADPNGFGNRPPYYLDLNAGRMLQFLGPLRDNGSYELRLESGLGRVPGEQTKTSATFTLARSCRPAGN